MCNTLCDIWLNADKIIAFYIICSKDILLAWKMIVIHVLQINLLKNLTQLDCQFFVAVHLVTLHVSCHICSPLDTSNSRTRFAKLQVSPTNKFHIRFAELHTEVSILKHITSTGAAAVCEQVHRPERSHNQPPSELTTPGSGIQPPH